MTLKYESEILFDLMKRDGDDTPSDVLPYESELKEKYLKQVEGAYPKLMDYRPEWLNYNLYAHLPADFPVETLSNVTNATVDNVVPYAYGRAILKGQTLVNLLDRNTMTTEEVNYTFNKGVFTVNTKKEWCKIIFKPNLVKNKKYLIMLSTSIPDVLIFYRDSSNKATRICNAGDCPFIFTNPVDNLASVSIEFPTIVTNGTVSHPMFIEYQEGMENWGISYFEGMQSVQMPELTTTGKNLLCVGRGCDDTITYNGLTITRDAVNQTITLNGTATQDNSSQKLENLFFHKIKKDERYALTCYLVSGKADRIAFRVHEKKWAGSMTCELNKPSYKTFDNDVVFDDCSFRVDSGATFKNAVFKVMFEKIDVNSTASSYEPYKSNILTSPKDLELRGIGDVQDTLDCLTGKVTQRIGEVVLDGSLQAEGVYPQVGETVGFYFPLDTIQIKPVDDVDIPKIINCDKFKVEKHEYQWADGKWLDEEFLSATADGRIAIRLLATKASTIVELHQYLSQNPITVQYPLASESIKTVDLTITDQNGNTESNIRPFEGTMHVSTSSQALPPLLDMSVPVEATTQNLMSFANIKEEE